jgi:hypothetical protein
MFNILYNVMIKLINYERFSTNDDEYLKLANGMRRTTFKVSNHSTLSSSKAKCNPPTLTQWGCQMLKRIFNHLERVVLANENQYNAGILDTINKTVRETIKGVKNESHATVYTHNFSEVLHVQRHCKTQWLLRSANTFLSPKKPSTTFPSILTC